MENTIAVRIFDFLKNHPPFNFLEASDLLAIAEKVRVQYFTDDEVIFKQGEPPVDYFYVIHEGAVELFRESEDSNVLIDTCDEGDVFGLRPLIASQAYALTAIAKEEALIYAIPTERFFPLLDRNAKVNHFLTSSFAAGERNPYAQNNKGKLFAENDQIWQSGTELLEIQSIDRSKKPVTCKQGKTVQEAAQHMRKKRVGSIVIVDDKGLPVGIITDRDLRNKIVTGDLPLSTSASEIMSSPVICIPPSAAVADVQIEMIRKGVHHLCVTEDGTNNTPVIGVISEHDLLVVQANNPAVLIREITRAKNGVDMRFIRDKAEILLRKYLFQEVSIAFISNIMSEINDSLIARAVQLAFKKLDKQDLDRPKADFCWLALGSEGREEQLLRTDQDNALIFEDVPKEDYESTKDYYLKLSKIVTDILNECGFEYCPAEMMASNPRWCLSLSEWERQFDDWIYRPGKEEVMFTTIFFDYRPIYGKMELSKQLTDSIYKSISNQDIFLGHLAKNALQNPAPLSFFRNFVVERSGEHKDEFDIKARAMMPLTDAARLLILEARQYGINNTFQRFDHMAKLEPQNAELYEQAADAYEILMRFRALQGLQNKDSGRFFRPDELNKMQRMMLRNCFKPIKDLQDCYRIYTSLLIIK
jgi:CBS domain-containing protein